MTHGAQAPESLPVIGWPVPNCRADLLVVVPINPDQPL
jgi:hypothetical protein